MFLRVHGDDLTGDEDGHDEIQTSLNSCEWCFLGKFSKINLYISVVVVFHIFVNF